MGEALNYRFMNPATLKEDTAKKMQEIRERTEVISDQVRYLELAVYDLPTNESDREFIEAVKDAKKIISQAHTKWMEIKRIKTDYAKDNSTE